MIERCQKCNHELADYGFEQQCDHCKVRELQTTVEQLTKDKEEIQKYCDTLKNELKTAWKRGNYE